MNGIRGDLRLRPRQGLEERRLTAVRQADEPDVRDEAELEMQVTLLTRIAQLARTRRLTRRRREAGVAAASAPAAGTERHGAGPVEVGEHAVALADDRAHRDVERQIRPLVTGPLAAGTRLGHPRR